MPRRRRSRSMSSSRSRSRTPNRTRNASSRDRNLRDAALGGEEQSGRKRKVSAHNLNAQNKALKTIASKAKSLEPQEINLHIENNRKAHHTDEYEHTNLIVRRGQAFDVTIEFNRAYSAKDDAVTVQFVTGSRPQESKGTLLRLNVSSEAPHDIERWHVQYKASSGSSFTVAVTPSAEAIIGKYTIFVETGKLGANQTRKEFDDEVIVLFNPWCKDDAVHMNKTADLEEYVLNETGRIWMGTESSFEPMAWNFSQFDDVCLDAALYLLDKSELATTARSNPIHVVRTMAAMSNSNDADGGVLTGRWTDTFPKNCTEPWAWTGSAAILQKFMKRKKAVRYGQCWVFSGLVTTLCRTLGIATRSVTNFESAHDCDASMTIDCHWDEKDDPMEDLNDSIWNFHVWNESYFRRPDLPEGYGGWQAHDSTPQELSEGVMRCGPVSVKAVKEGHVYLPYDTPFMFAEVNGDKVHWLVKEDGSMEVLAKKKKVPTATLR